MLIIFIYCLRDNIEIELLGRARLRKVKQREALRWCIFQPIFDRDTIAFRLRNFLAFFIKEQLIDKLYWWIAAQNLTNLGIERRIVLMIFAEHFEVHAKGRPAHAEIRLPLEFHISACHRQRDFRSVFIVKCDGSRFSVHGFHRHIEYATRGRGDREKRRIGRAAFFAQRRQHHFHDVIEFLQGL